MTELRNSAPVMPGPEMPAPVTRLLRIDAANPESAPLQEAAALIRAGELVAFPTETVYGLGANALNPEAVRKVYQAKGRPAADPLIVHVNSIQAMAELTTLPVARLARLEGFWPGPLTVVVPRAESIPLEVTAGMDSVGLRIPAHPVARALIEAAGVPIAAPSANSFTRPSPTEARHVLEDLNGRIPLVLDGGSTWHGMESTVIDLTVDPPALLRPGALTVEQLHQVLPQLVLSEPRFEAMEPSESDPESTSGHRLVGLKSPGTHLKHYSPRAPVTLFQGQDDAVQRRLWQAVTQAVSEGKKVGVLLPEEWLEPLQSLPHSLATRVEGASLGQRTRPEQAAQRLFGGLRLLDARGVELIFSALFPMEGLGRTLNDRLLRSAEGRVQVV